MQLMKGQHMDMSMHGIKNGSQEYLKYTQKHEWIWNESGGISVEIHLE